MQSFIIGKPTARHEVSILQLQSFKSYFCIHILTVGDCLQLKINIQYQAL